MTALRDSTGWRRTAFHEAGHAVVCRALHISVGEIAVKPEGGGYTYAEADGHPPADRAAVYVAGAVAHATTGKQLARFPLNDDRTAFLCVFRRDLMTGGEPRDLAEKRGVLQEIFGAGGWESEPMIEALARADEIYFDRVSQIKMPSWSSGRIALIGDAAAAVSLLAGEGAGLGMTEAYVLSGELQRARGVFCVRRAGGPPHNSILGLVLKPVACGTPGVCR